MTNKQHLVSFSPLVAHSLQSVSPMALSHYWDVPESGFLFGSRREGNPTNGTYA